MAGIAEVSTRIFTRFFPESPQRLTPGAIRILRKQRRADCGKAKRELGYEPTSVLDAIHQAHEDFAARGLIEAGAAQQRSAPRAADASSSPPAAM